MSTYRRPLHRCASRDGLILPEEAITAEQCSNLIELAVEVCNALKKESPNIFHEIEVYDEDGGMPAVRVTQSKV